MGEYGIWWREKIALAPMKNDWLTKTLTVGLSVFALTVTACSPAIEEEAIEETPSETSNAITNEAGETLEDNRTLGEPIAQSPATTPVAEAPETEIDNESELESPSTDTVSEIFYLSQYQSESWEITIAEGAQGFTYYGCNTGDGLEDPCIVLTEGTRTCGGDVCIYEWVSGDITYEAEISEYGNNLLVSQGDTVLLEEPYLEPFYTSDDDIPADREDVTGISEAQLKATADQIYQAVYERNWQALASLSTDPVKVNYPDEEKSTEVSNSDLPDILSEADLTQWEARIMTNTIDDLLLNQYGAMFGGGGIWISEIIGESEPQIYSINIW
ncbi:hypothetical protein Lepto7376_0435 [[Leptolyngbya] sp. PCC 7376]|uniref:hypothetical protein n=1 Tax=[Leptolyngbya] sp. PCC 7376 TaxID=111781 RepID=UPI00029EE3C7|nr:hypothetical protein [[Leptolyngbya] sp. PCC 7376]AFY36870.1 hypothetical protein Lepto7376_0435 [[Leptolyngbya] sp. PCC 7376]